MENRPPVNIPENGKKSFNNLMWENRGHGFGAGDIYIGFGAAWAEVKLPNHLKMKVAVG
jgi:hypothetical protein